MLNQSFKQVFVIDNPVLLAQGTTVDLGVGQLGIFDGNTYKATQSPTYAKNKALIFAQGRPDMSSQGLMAGMSNASHKTKLIRGKTIKNFRGFKAQRGKNEIATIGFDGLDVTKTLRANCNQEKVVYLKLTGEPMTKLFSDQGVTRQYHLTTPSCNGCTNDDPCAVVCAEPLADQLISKINSDPKINSYVRASKLVSCTPVRPPITGSVSYTRYQVNVVDNGDVQALGMVQDAYPQSIEQYDGYPGTGSFTGLGSLYSDRNITNGVKRVARDGVVSVYELVQRTANTAPTAFSSSFNVVIDNCKTCPTGYTFVDNLQVYKVQRNDNNTDVSATIKTDYAATTVVKIGEDYGLGSYLVRRTTKITTNPVATDVVSFVSTSSTSCVLTTPQTYNWIFVGTLLSFPKKSTLTIQDSCNTDRLAEVQAAYPSLVVTLSPLTSVSCIHRYETTIYSKPVDSTCGVESMVFINPDAFKGISWVCEDTIVTDCQNCVAGVKVEAVFVNRLSSECSYDTFTREYDGVHIELSEYNPNYNANPNKDTNWPVTYLQKIQYVQGDGHFVKKQEMLSLGYELEHRSQDVGVREAEGYTNFASLTKYYDEYTIEFDFGYKVGGWADTYVDSYHLTIYVPEGTGANVEQAINSYISSAQLDLPLVVL